MEVGGKKAPTSLNLLPALNNKGNASSLNQQRRQEELEKSQADMLLEESLIEEEQKILDQSNVLDKSLPIGKPKIAVQDPLSIKKPIKLNKLS